MDTKNERSPWCNICDEEQEFDDKHPSLIFICGHRFHTKCLMKFYSVNNLSHVKCRYNCEEEDLWYDDSTPGYDVVG